MKETLVTSLFFPPEISHLGEAILILVFCSFTRNLSSMSKWHVFLSVNNSDSVLKLRVTGVSFPCLGSLVGAIFCTIHMPQMGVSSQFNLYEFDSSRIAL
ncbi:unnamed protein product [Cuscuta epithymum]|uniref:Uncharacterized protein n=1 Tax=Cuscuta epithymum TaxID=186058 RepID=A0AAV0FX72_9ASTE|nr:unnamed protein product [Cuscuta epithymum]